MTSNISANFSLTAKRLRPFVAFLLVTVMLVTGAFLVSGNVAKAEPAENAATVTSETAPNSATSSTEAAPVRVAFFPLDGFYEYDADESRTGYGVEYFNAVAESAGIKYEYVTASSWVEALEMFDEGKVDVLAPSQMTAERSEKYRFCPIPIGMEYGSLLTTNDNDALTYEDYAAFNGRKVGCVESIIFMDSYRDYEQNHGFETQLVYYKDTQAVLDALHKGEVDAVMVNLMVKTDDLKVLGKFGAAPIYFMVRPDDAQLQATLNEALQTFTTSNPSFQSQLTDKYFAAFNQTPFSNKELEFAASCDPINVGIASNAAPLAHLDDQGAACGVDVEILNTIVDTSGLSFNYIPLPEGVVDEAYLVDHDIALVTGVEVNSANAKLDGMRLSKPYQTMSKVFVADPSHTYDMKGSLRVAVAGESDENAAYLSAEHPNFKVLQYNNTEECLDAVQNGDADVVFQNRYLVERCLSNPHYEGLGVLPVEGELTDYAFGLVDKVVTSSYGDGGVDMIKSILDKSITQIPEQTIDELLATEVTESQYRPSLADMVYQYRGPLVVIVISLLCVIAALSFAVHVQARNRRRIQDNEQKLANISNNINGGVLVINGDDSLRITYANDGFLELIGCSRREFEQLHHNSYLTYVHPDDVRSLKEVASKSLDDLGERISIPLKLRRDDGTYLDTLFNGTIRETSDGERQMYCVITDISEQVSLLNRLTLEKKRADLFFRKSDNVIYEVNLQEGTITTSDNMKAMLGWSLPERPSMADSSDFLKMWHTDDESKELLRSTTRDLLDNKKDVKCTIPLRAVSGENIWCEIDQYPVLGSKGQIVSVVGRILDVNDAVAEKNQLEYLARVDTMTGLLKKEPFVQETRTYLEAGHPENCALLFVDVDHFKEVNDTLGHEKGDECLKGVAQKLSVAFAGLDLIGRFGGDEFVVFVKNIPHDTLVDRLDWLKTRLKQDYSSEDGKASLSISCSIGAACTQDFGQEYEQLLKHADAALYEAKNRGRAQFVMAQPND